MSKAPGITHNPFSPAPPRWRCRWPLGLQATQSRQVEAQGSAYQPIPRRPSCSPNFSSAACCGWVGDAVSCCGRGASCSADANANANANAGHASHASAGHASHASAHRAPSGRISRRARSNASPKGRHCQRALQKGSSANRHRFRHASAAAGSRKSRAGWPAASSAAICLRPAPLPGRRLQVCELCGDMCVQLQLTLASSATASTSPLFLSSCTACSRASRV